MALSVEVIDLGPNNTGAFGPDDLTPEERQTVVQDLGAEACSKKASRRWICVDGRLPVGGVAAESDEADSQIAGSLPVSETAADFMDDESAHKPLSQAVADNTRAAVNDGYTPVMHGDEKAGKAGCAANKRMREVLHFNAEHADIVGPKAWAVLELLGVSSHLNKDDLTASINNGVKAANNEELWDATPEDVVDIAVANGAEYEVLDGDHCEKTMRLDLTEDGAFDKARYVKDHSTADKTIQAFAASFGAYVKAAFERGEKHGRDERQTALKIARVMLYNVGLTKMLSTEEMQVGLIGVQ